jgi:hypothetical protein
LDDSGADGIALYIRRGSPEVVLVQWAGVNAAKQNGQRVLPFGNGDEVNMIRHQAEAEDGDLGVGQVVAEESQAP